MLPLDLGVDQRLCQTQAGRLVGQGAILADAGAAPARRSASGWRCDDQPSSSQWTPTPCSTHWRNAWVVICANPCSRTALHPTNRVLGFAAAVARTDDEPVAAAPDLGALGDDVEGGAVPVGREEPDGLALGFPVLADFFRQADGGERAAGAEAFVVGDGRPFDGSRSRRAVGDGGAAVGAGRVVDGDADGTLSA